MLTGFWAAAFSLLSAFDKSPSAMRRIGRDVWRLLADNSWRPPCGIHFVGYLQRMVLVCAFRCTNKQNTSQ
eukprot:UN3141